MSNHVFLRIYHFISFIPVPRKIRDQNYISNIVQLNNTSWDFWTVPSAYIENQNEWGNIIFGAGKHHNMSHSGCEVIAAFNEMLTIAIMGQMHLILCILYTLRI